MSVEDKLKASIARRLAKIQAAEAAIAELPEGQRLVQEYILNLARTNLEELQKIVAAGQEQIEGSAQ